MRDKNINFHIITVYKVLSMILRDKSKITKLLILLEIAKGRRKLREIAESIDVTVQAVSEYMKELEREGLVHNWKIRPRGFAFISSAIEEIGEFVHTASDLIKKERVTEAIAGEPIKKGERVGLFMKNGYLWAYKKDSSSTGIALNDAEPMQDVGVSSLQGIIEFERGKVKVYGMPSIECGGSRAVDRNFIKHILDSKPENTKVGIWGIVPYLSIKNLTSIDFEFSAVNAAVDAAYRGIDSILFVSHEYLPYALQILQEKGVEYVVHDVPKNQ